VAHLAWAERDTDPSRRQQLTLQLVYSAQAGFAAQAPWASVMQAGCGLALPWACKQAWHAALGAMAMQMLEAQSASHGAPAVQPQYVMAFAIGSDAPAPFA
jgi:hypothetical protein